MDQAVKTYYLFIDGECMLCEKAVFKIDRWLKSDAPITIYLTSLQNADKIKDQLGFSLPQDIDSVLLWNGTKLLTKMDVVLCLSTYMRGRFKGFLALKILPRFFRNWIYDLIATNRYKWFGKKSSCLLPSGLKNLILIN